MPTASMPTVTTDRASMTMRQSLALGVVTFLLMLPETLPVPVLKKVFAVILSIMAIKMTVSLI